MGIAGALGLATIAAPLSGVMASPPPKMLTNSVSAVALAPAPEFPERAGAARTAVEDLRVIPASDPSLSAVVPKALVPPRIVLVSRASRSNERAVLPGCDGRPSQTNAANGQLSSSDLCSLWESDHRLRADAAVSAAKLNVAYRQRFGENMCITDSYRTYAEQVSLKAQKPGLAAVPGTSNHGWGLALDLCDSVQNAGSSRYLWMRANAPRYGWDNPGWARSGGSGPYEPWHWEYVVVTEA